MVGRDHTRIQSSVINAARSQLQIGTDTLTRKRLNHRAVLDESDVGKMRVYSQKHNLQGFETWSDIYQVKAAGALNGEGYVEMTDPKYTSK
jgi:hypothetical protein